MRKQGGEGRATVGGVGRPVVEPHTFVGANAPITV